MSLLSERQLRDELAGVRLELDQLRQRFDVDEANRCSDFTEEERILVDAACRLLERKIVVHKRQRFEERAA
jgi:hypothetical protein